MERLELIKACVEKRTTTLNRNIQNLVYLWKEAIEARQPKYARQLAKQIDCNLQRLRTYKVVNHG